MSGKVVGGSNGTRTGKNSILTDIPSGSRTIVQSLKEIVNCPEAEIYAALKDCNMDPNEAVSRLLSQDPFHEVKSKRDKKKESKETTDYRPRSNSASIRGGRGGSGRYTGRGGATNFSSNELGNFHGRPANKKENGNQTYAGSSSSASVAAGRQPPPHSDPIATDDKRAPALDDGDSLSRPSSGHQSAWFGSTGQMSMADIVKMGRRQNTSSSVTNLSRQNVDLDSDGADEYRLHANQHVPLTEEWPSIEKPITESDSCLDPSDLQSGRANQPLNSQMDEVHASENGSVESHLRVQVQHDSVRHLQGDDSGGPSQFDEGVYNNMESYQSQSHHPLKQDEDEEDVSAVAANLQQLSIENHDNEASPEEDTPGLIIPEHLQVHTSECSHLSFGSFGAFGSMPQSYDLGEAPEAATSVDHPDTRNTEFYADEHLRSIPDGCMAHLANPSAGNYKSSLDSQREIMKQEIPEAAQENQYTLSSGEQGYAYENTPQLKTTFEAQQSGSQMQNLISFSNVMQAYTNSMPSTLLAHTPQMLREVDPRYSAFPVGQSLQNKYGNNASSLSEPSISTPEGLRGSGNSVTQPAQQTLPGASLATGSILPQHLAMHPYSQPSLALPQFSNMLGYPLLHQSYPYLPSAAFAGNSTYHQSLAALLPQYKNSVSVSSLPQSATVASGYGFGNSNSGPGGNFPHNQHAAPTGATLSYEDVLSSSYKDDNHLLSLQQQNDNSPLWHQGPGSRTMSGVPASNYYNHLQGQQQSQPTSGFRQAQQQPSQQHYGSLGYPNFYQSQTGISMEHQQQNPRDGSLGGSQGGQLPQQNQQLWQNSY